MKIPQLSVFLENRSGRLAHVTNVLKEANVNILALSLADTSDFGILRLIVDNTDVAKQVLSEHDILAMINEVTAVEVENKPGGLAAVLNVLEDNSLNVEYMYAFIESKNQKGALIFRFDDPEVAVEKLQAAGVGIINQNDIF